MYSSDTAILLKDNLLKIVGSENLKDDTISLEIYSKDHSFINRNQPLFIVYPVNKYQVKEIVKLANEYKIPLTPVSSGSPHFRGDTIPEQGGIIIDFSNMKRILKIDTINRYALIESGVTYGELLPELKKQGLKMNKPLLPRSSKSVVTSLLEREPVIIPKYQYDYTDPLLTLEVIYGTGDEFRTGSASGPGPFEKLQADKVNPWGPGSIDFFRFVSGAQGTMGLVTWAATKTEICPSIQKLYFISADDLNLLMTLADRLLRPRVLDECLILNNVNLASILARSWPDDYEELKSSLPSWTMLVCIAGYHRRPEERLEIQGKYLFDICEGLKIIPQTTLLGANGAENNILELLSNPWTEDPYWKLRAKGSCQDIFFLSPLSKAAEFIKVMKEVVAKCKYPFEDIGSYIQPLVQGRGCHIEFNLSFNEADKEEMAKVQKLLVEASETLMRNGAFFSRPYGLWAQMVFQSYSEGTIALRKLKKIFDPNNILNPGKLCF